MAYYIGFAKITKLGLIYHIRSYNTITTKDDAIQKELSTRRKWREKQKFTFKTVQKQNRPITAHI